MSTAQVRLPIITIVTPSYNQGGYIEKTIQSVLSQDYPYIEYIVMDGGSIDNTLEILRKYEGRFRWVSEKDRGQSDAINKGFRMAKGEILAWLNSDDIYLPGAIGKVARYFVAHPDVSMLYGEGYMIDEEGTVKSRFPFTEPKFDLAKLIYHGDYILQQSCFFRRTVFDSIGMLDDSLHYGMDWDLFIRIGKRFRVDYIPDYLGCIREHAVAKTSIGGRERFRELVRIIRNHGILRYPPSYWNYAWDAYGKPWFGEAIGASVEKRFVDYVLAGGKRVLRSALSLHVKSLEAGCFTDGWVGRRAVLAVPNFSPGSQRMKLLIKGKVFEPNLPLRIKVTLNKKSRSLHKVDREGEFDLNIEIPTELADSDCYHVQLKGSKTFVPRKLGINTDERELAFLLTRIEVTS